jgi:hypothetical protein
MRYLLSSHAMLVSVDVAPDFTVGGFEILSKGYHFGIALGGRDGSVRRTVVAYRGGETVDNQATPEILFFEERNGGFQNGDRKGLPGLGNVHQLACCWGGIIIADTQHDRILFRGPGRSHEWVLGAGYSDRHHINSVFPTGNRVLILLHNRRRRESQIVVLRFDPVEGFMLEAELSLWDILCHNLWVDPEAGVLLYNASLVNKLVVVDLHRDRMERRVDLSPAALVLPSRKGHTKGLSVSEDYLAIGLSEETSRDQRASSRSCLVLLDRRSLEIAGIVRLDVLPSPVGNINDVRRLDRTELALGLSVDSGVLWKELRLGKNGLLFHAFRRLQGHVALPAIRVKRKLERLKSIGKNGLALFS